jgi:hypothetical protein
MTQPPRQPLFWAAMTFSLGLWTGVRAWRPPSWWVIALVAFVLAASWFLPKRAWLAKALSLGAWFLLGAFLIQVRGPRPAELQQDDARILALSDGRAVTLTARVFREGYARAAEPKSISGSIDVETEKIESQGESWPVRAGVRLTIYEKVEDRAIGPAGDRVILDDPMTRSPDPSRLSTCSGLWHAPSHRREAASGAQLSQSRSLRLRRLSARQRHQCAGVGGGKRH